MAPTIVSTTAAYAPPQPYPTAPEYTSSFSSITSGRGRTLRYRVVAN